MEPRKGVPRVVAVLAGLLQRAAERGDDDSGAQVSSASAFRGRTRPGIAVRRYAERIYRYAGCSPACFVVASVYLDRLARRREAESDEEEEQEETACDAAVFRVDSHSVHRLLITSVMVAAKFMDDVHYNNAYFARVGGVEVAEMNGLELELLFALRFRLNVTPDTFARYCAKLEGQMIMLAAPVVGPLPLLIPAAAPTATPEEDPELRKQDRRAGAVTGGAVAFAAAAQRAIVQ